MNRKIFLTISAVTAMLISCTPKNTEESAQDTEAKIATVKVEDVKTADVAQIVDFTGNIEPFVKNMISSSSAQRIEKIYVEVGSQVKKGQLLVRMENLNYAQAKIQLENLKLDMSRIEALYKAGGVSKQQYDQMKTQVSVAEESIANLDKNTRLLSPISGVVTQRNFDSGDLTMGQPILVVMQLQPVKIMISISEEYFPKVKVGTPVDITLDVYEGKTFPGKVSLIYPTIDPTTKTFQVQVSINNPSMQIRPGMFARAKVNFGMKKRLVVPDKAVIKQQGTNDKFVYVVDGDVVNYVKIETEQRNGQIYEVLNGLEEGQKVVIAGISQLKDKAKVKIVTSGVDLSL